MKEAKEKIVRNFLESIVKGEIDEAYEKYVDEKDFKHHNQYFKGDKESIINAQKEDFKNNPKKEFEIKMIINDNEKIMSYSYIKSKKDDEFAVCHIFKFNDNNKIIEMWDIGTPILKDSPNNNGNF
jgi:predicted SnoaL-like aldol condensation-catalyzing enzyme